MALSSRKFFAALGRIGAWPFLWLRRNFDGQDVLFYCGVALLGHGVRQISEPYAFIVIGALLIFHGYAPDIREIIRPAGRSESK